MAMDDLQFAQRYGQLVETAGDGECAVFEFHHELGRVRSVFLKREIPALIDGELYFEAVTPCAYGGPVMLNCKDGRRWELAAAFGRAFRLYCLEQNIIREQVRFHPVLGNAADFAGCYETEFIGETAAIDLRVPNPVCDEFMPHCKKSLFKALEHGVDYRVTAGPADARHLAQLYLSIAGQNRTSSIDDAHRLTTCIEKMGPDLVITEAVYKEQTIALSLSSLNGVVLQLERIAVMPALAHLSPECVLHYGVTCWGKQHGASFIHLGELGERSAFKAEFSRSTRFEFWQGHKIWNSTANAKRWPVGGGDHFKGRETVET